MILFLLVIAMIPWVTAAQLPSLDWTLATPHAEFSDRVGHSSVVYDDNLWVIGGMSGTTLEYFSDVWRSGDGVTWTQVTPRTAFGRRTGQGSVVFGDKMWVIAGREGGTSRFMNDIWYSEDGITWKRAAEHAPFAPRVEFATVVYDDKIWVIGGNANDGTPCNDVWYSSDGVTWSEATSHAKFSPRMEPSACVYDGKIWITGGFDWNGVYNDVWSSQDGRTWTEVSAHAAFPARRYQAMETFAGRMWVIGGMDGKNSLNDVWYSTDGISWTGTTGETTFSPRWGFTTAAYSNRLWVIAGTNGNNVWHSQEVDSSAAEGGSTGFISDVPANLSGILVTKSISPVSMKQGTEARITITVFNSGPEPVHDISILDTTRSEFPVTGGAMSEEIPLIEPNDSRILSYTVQATTPGSFRLNATAVMYADIDGNYHISHSNTETVVVLVPLLNVPAERKPDDLLQNFFSWVESLNHGRQ